MGFKIEKEMMDDIAILHASGELVGGPPTSVIFRSEIQKLFEKNITKVVFDFKKVKRINSTGLGLLISGHDLITKGGGDLKLARLSESTKGLIVMTKLDSYFDTFATLEGAVGNFH
ncbi:MAG: STAS domain-containing protein [bacterium]|jgi:anti-anti-sigma factor